MLDNDDDDEEFLREGRTVRLGPAAGYQRRQSPPGYRVTEKEEKHAQKVGKSHGWNKFLKSLCFTLDAGSTEYILSKPGTFPGVLQSL